MLVFPHKRTNSQAEYKAGVKPGRAPQFKAMLRAAAMFFTFEKSQNVLGRACVRACAHAVCIYTYTVDKVT
jgi:hypothetical protein